MSYLEGLLYPEEQFVYHTRLHWQMLIPSLFVFLFGIFFFFMAGLLEVGLIILLTGLSFSVIRCLAYLGTEIAVTDLRVILKAGVSKRNILEIQKENVAGVEIHQDIWGRIMGYGNIAVTVIEGKGLKFKKVVAPETLRDQIQGQML